MQFGDQLENIVLQLPNEILREREIEGCGSRWKNSSGIYISNVNATVCYGYMNVLKSTHRQR